MMKFGKSAMVALAMSALIAGLTDCQKKKVRWSAPARKSIRRQKKPGSRSKRLVRKYRTRQKTPQNNSLGEARRLKLPMAA